MKFELEDFHRNITDEELIVDIKRVAEELKQNSVNRKQQDEKGKFNSSTLIRRFGSWLKALEKAGFQGTKQQLNSRGITEEELFKNLEEVWIKLGRQPRRREIQLSKYSPGPYKRCFGSWMKALEKFVAHVNKEENISSEQGISNLEVEPITRHKTQRGVNWRLRFIVMRRDNFKCRNCGRSPATDPGIVLHIDHIKAWTNGGETVLENLQTLCSKCNIGKSNL